MIANRKGIEERPEGANSRTEVGHWEGDTAVSRASKTALLVLQERKLGLTLLEKLPRCAPEEMKAGVNGVLVCQAWRAPVPQGAHIVVVGNVVG
jgi:IS30 family transposase